MSLDNAARHDAPRAGDRRAGDRLPSTNLAVAPTRTVDKKLYARIDADDSITETAENDNRMRGPAILTVQP